MDSYGKLDIYNCNFIDNRGGSDNHSDGISTSAGSIIENCYFETGDDNIKIYRPNMIVNDCTFRMIQNSVPFQLGWGNYTHGCSMVATNIKIVGDWGRWGNPIIDTGDPAEYVTSYGDSNGNSHVTVTINGIYNENPNASLVVFRNQYQFLNGSVNDAKLGNIPFWGHSTNFGYTWRNTLNHCESQFNYINYFNHNNNVAFSCSSTQWGGSTVDYYNVPTFANSFSISNVGNHSMVGNSNVANVNNTPSSICAGNGGCTPNLTITQTLSGTSNHAAQNEITATNIINAGANVTYTAGTRIRLQDGFHAKNSSDFHAYISSCTSPLIDNSDDAYAVSDESQQAWEMSNTETELLNEKRLVSGDSFLKIFPNPFQGSTNVSYSLPQKGMVSISVFDNTGREVAVLENKTVKEQGEYQLEFNAFKLPKGIYFIRLFSDKHNATRKMIITD